MFFLAQLGEHFSIIGYGFHVFALNVQGMLPCAMFYILIIIVNELLANFFSETKVDLPV